MANKEPDIDDIIKYLGYETHPGKIGEFWNSDEEKKQYLAGVKARGGQYSALEREQALLNVRLMSTADKVISFIGSALLVISFFLPVYSFDVHGQSLSGSAISLFLNLPVAGGYASWGGGVMVFSLFLYSLFLIACPVVGVLNILGLINKNQGEDYFDTIKKNSRFVFIPIAIFGLLFLVLIYGAPQPFGSLGVDALGDNFNLAAIFKMTGFGFWLNIAGLAIVFAERRGI
jgi:hypothetical protein